MAMVCYRTGTHFHRAFGEGLIRFLTVFSIGEKEMDTRTQKIQILIAEQASPLKNSDCAVRVKFVALFGAALVLGLSIKKCRLCRLQV